MIKIILIREFSHYFQLTVGLRHLSKDSIYRILKSFDKIYSEFTDAEKKRFIGSFVECVEIYEEEQENGRFLKSIKFRFPVYYNGTETQEVDLSDSSWDYQRSLETVVLLNNKFAKAKDFVQIGIDAEDYYRIKDAKKIEVEEKG